METLTMLAWLGGFGLGSVWGWLMALIWGRGSARRSPVNILSAAAAIILFSLQQLFQATWQSVPFFLGGAFLGAVLHAWLLSWLRRTKV